MRVLVGCLLVTYISFISYKNYTLSSELDDLKNLSLLQTTVDNKDFEKCVKSLHQCADNLNQTAGNLTECVGLLKQKGI